jgi:hypothetical protein
MRPRSVSGRSEGEKENLVSRVLSPWVGLGQMPARLLHHVVLTLTDDPLPTGAVQRQLPDPRRLLIRSVLRIDTRH